MTSPASPSPQPTQPLVVWWAMWAAFQIGIAFIYFKLGKSSGAPPPVHEPAFWQLGFFPVLISGAIRWSLLPRFRNSIQALPVFILGLALAEVSCFLGIFIFPSHKLLLFIGSVIGIFQFIPLYAGRFYRPEE
jgi:hypothetical protein